MNGLKFGLGWSFLIRILLMLELLTTLFPHRAIRVPIITLICILMDTSLAVDHESSGVYVN